MMEDAGSSGAPSSVLRPRLALADEAGMPTPSDLGLTDAKSQAFRWQTYRGDPHAALDEMAWLSVDVRASRWIREIHGLYGIVGELILVCIEAEVEKWCLEEKLEEPATTGPVRAALARSLRFFGEGQANQLVVAGHAAANIVLRTIALHPDFDASILPRGLNIDEGVFEPRSNHRRAWCGLNHQTAKDLEKAAKALGSAELAALARSLRQLTAGNEAWAELNAMRGEQYHRWRGESDGVSGINFGDPAMADRLGAGQAVGIGNTQTPYDEGAAAVAEVCIRSASALASFVTWMPEFAALQHAANESLQDPALRTSALRSAPSCGSLLVARTVGGAVERFGAALAHLIRRR